MDMIDRLRQKGWTEQDIERAMQIMQSQELAAKHVDYTVSANRILYWSALIIAIMGNLLMSVVLIPFLISIEGGMLYLIIAIIGMVFGFLITVLLRDIEHIDYKHHILAGVFLPVLGLINVYMMVTLSNRIAASATFASANLFSHNPLVVSTTYVAAFIAPYFIYKIIDMRTNSETQHTQFYR